MSELAEGERYTDSEVKEEDIKVLTPLDALMHGDGSQDQAKDHECGICSRTYKSKWSLTRHIRSEHVEGCVCSTCKKTFRTEEEVAAHKNEKHNKTYICDTCGTSFKHKHHMTEHAKQKHSDDYEEGIFKCPYENCDRKFVRKPMFQDHLNVHTNLKPHACKNCAKCFSSRYNMRAHERSCSKGSFVCKTCGVEYRTKWSLRHHMEGEHSSGRYACMCGKIYKFKTSLHKHKKKNNH